MRLGVNRWGNLRRHVAMRSAPHVTGFVISDLGETVVVATDAEDGNPMVGFAKDWCAVDSPAHLKALAREDG